MIIHFIGTGAPQLAIMVVLAMSVAVLLNGSELVISEAAVSAMLLVITGPSGGAAFSPEPHPRGRDRRRRRAGASRCSFSPDPMLPVSAAPPRPCSAGSAARWSAPRARWTTATPARAEQALEQARSIEGLLRELDAELATSRETVRTAPTRFGDREPIDRYDRSLGQIDLAVRNTRVLARHSLRAIRAGEAPVALRDAVSDLAGSVWALAAVLRRARRAPARRASWPRPRPCGRPRSALGAGLAYAEVAAPVRSTAVDLMRAAELVAGAPEELPTEELLLQPAPIEETGWVLTLA